VNGKSPTEKNNFIAYIQCVVLIVLTVVSLNAVAKGSGVDSRIVGGSIASMADYPFVVYYSVDDIGAEVGTPSCTGSLIDSRWVLTAAHCLHDVSLSENTVNVVVGRQDITKDDGVVVIASRIIVHPQYDRNNSDSGFDIALVQLARSASSNIISLPSRESSVPRVDETVVLAGWGRTAYRGEVADQLREVSVPVVSDIDCLPYYPTSLNADSNFCLLSPVESPGGSCNGDSGGPIFVVRDGFYVQAGVIGGAIRCALPGVPGYATQVTTFVDWISSYVPSVNVIRSEPAVPVSGFALENEPNTEFFTRITVQSPESDSTGTVRQHERVMYEVTGSAVVSLESKAGGDADLFVVAGFDDTPERSGLCASDEPGSAVDRCELENSDRRMFAIVIGYSHLATDYTLSVQAQMQNDDSGPVDNLNQGNDSIAGDATIQRVRSGGGILEWLTLIGLIGGIVSRFLTRETKPVSM